MRAEMRERSTPFSVSTHRSSGAQPEGGAPNASTGTSPPSSYEHSESDSDSQLLCGVRGKPSGFQRGPLVGDGGGGGAATVATAAAGSVAAGVATGAAAAAARACIQ
eukprot:277583-Chlamydomonas_euryale.AAC.1